jgi:hypothetical protein
MRKHYKKKNKQAKSSRNNGVIMRNHKSTVYLRANLFFMTTPSVLGTESVHDFELVFLIPPRIPMLRLLQSQYWVFDSPSCHAIQGK